MYRPIRPTITTGTTQSRSHSISFRFRKAIKLGPFRIHVSQRVESSVNVGRVSFRRGHTPRFSTPLFGGLSWFFGGKRKRR